MKYFLLECQKCGSSKVNIEPIGGKYYLSCQECDTYEFYEVES